MEFLQNIQELTFAGNELWRLLLLLICITGAWILAKLAGFFMRRVKRKMEAADRKVLAVFLGAVAANLSFLLVMLGIRLALHFLIIPEPMNELVELTTVVLTIIALAIVLYRSTEAVDYWLHQYTSDVADQLDDMLIPIVGRALRVIIVLMAILQIAQVVSEQELTHILAGLGVGGLAVALAGQDMIKNFFASLMIFSDKPFNIGDWVAIDGENGTIEEVGIRSSRVRTFEGVRLVIPNNELINKTIHNVQVREFIRRWASIGVTYDTPPEKLNEAIDIIKEILDQYRDSMPEERPPKVYFEEFDDYSLNILMVYWFIPPTYWDFVAFNHEINRQILQRFNEAGIQFAFPTQTLHLSGSIDRN